MWPPLGKWFGYTSYQNTKNSNRCCTLWALSVAAGFSKHRSEARLMITCGVTAEAGLSRIGTPLGVFQWSDCHTPTSWSAHYPLHRCRWNILEPLNTTGSFGINILSGTKWELSQPGKYEMSGELFLSFALLSEVFNMWMHKTRTKIDTREFPRKFRMGDVVLEVLA